MLNIFLSFRQYVAEQHLQTRESKLLPDTLNMQMQSIQRWIKTTSEEKKELLIKCNVQDRCGNWNRQGVQFKSHFKISNLLRSGKLHLHNHITVERECCSRTILCFTILWAERRGESSSYKSTGSFICALAQMCPKHIMGCDTFHTQNAIIYTLCQWIT